MKSKRELLSKKGSKLDKRKLKRLKRAAEKAKVRVNKKVYERIAELEKDPEFLKKIDQEIKKLKKPKDFRDYIKNANKLAKKEKCLRENLEKKQEK